MLTQTHRPIGIFDSGIGGLTVAHALVDALPAENIIYFGDTAHLPYGDKSAETIQYYTQGITQFLLEKQCKLILIACNSASAAAFETIQKTIGHQVIILNVIDPMIDHISQTPYQKLGLIGTRQTVHSNIYQHKISEKNPNITLISHETNLLASAIEEFGNQPILDHLIEAYLDHEKFKNIEALILACTHYPVIKNNIALFFKQKMKKEIPILDASDIVAAAVKKTLQQKKLLRETGTGIQHFYISDYTDSFVNHAKRFFSKNIQLEHYPLTHLLETVA